MNLIKKIFFILFLFYISLLPARLGFISQTANEILVILFSFTGVLSLALYLPGVKYRVDRFDLFLLAFLVLYPLFSSIVARITVGQPVYMGLLTFRSLYIILVWYAFLIMGFSQHSVLDYTEKVVFLVIIIATILFLVFNFNDFNTSFMKGSLAVKYGHTTTKGMQFSGFTSLFFIPYVYGWVRYFEKNKPGFLALPLLILIFSVYISKARNEILTMAILPLFMYYLRYRLYDIRYLLISGLIIVSFFYIALTDNVISRNFAGLLRPGDLEFAHKTKDYSAYLRYEEINAGWRWFLKYPITGIGSLSYRFNGGYQGVISDFFFISDIGILGILIKGGLILLALYYIFYRLLFKIFGNDDLFSLTGSYLVLFLLIELIIGNDYLFNYTGSIVILLLMKPTRKEIRREL
jgi:O-Antigen ligase